MPEKPTYEELEQKIRELEEAEFAYKQSENESLGDYPSFQILFETMAEGVVLIDPEGQIVHANQAAERILGLERSEIVKRNYIAPEWTVIRPDGTEMLPEEMAGPRVMKDKRPVKGMVMGLEHPDGAIVWINVSAAPLLDADGELEGIVSTFTDITEHQRDKEKLQLFKTLVEASPEAIAISDTKGQLIFINPAHEKLFGRSLAEACKLNYRDYYPPESIAILSELVAPALARGENWEGTIDSFDADGRRFPLWEHAGSILDEQGRMRYGFGIMHDESKRKRIEEKLEKSEEIMRSVVETSPVGIAIYDETGQCYMANDSLGNMLGATKAQILELNYNEIEAWKAYGMLGKAKIVLKKGIVKRFELIGASTFGKNVQLDCYLVPFGSGQLLFMGHDISERKQAEERLNEANDQLEEKIKERIAEIAEKNIALKVLLNKHEDEKSRFAETMLSNVEELIMPNIHKLKNSTLDSRQQTVLNIIESNLNEIVSPLLNSLSSRYLRLTPTEIQVANYIQHGASSKEIAHALGLSQRTIDAHRHNIRRKLEITGKRINLRTYLSSIS